MGKKRNANGILVGKNAGKRPFGRPRRSDLRATLRHVN
jgi:hypothetical protein